MIETITVEKYNEKFYSLRPDSNGISETFLYLIEVLIPVCVQTTYCVTWITVLHCSSFCSPGEVCGKAVILGFSSNHSGLQPRI